MAKKPKKNASKRSSSAAADGGNTKTLNLLFRDNALLTMLFGNEDEHLNRLEEKLGITARSRGNALTLSGKSEEVEAAYDILQHLYQRLEKGEEISMKDVDAGLRMSEPEGEKSAPASSGKKRREVTSDFAIKTQRKVIQPYSHAQEEYMQLLMSNDLVFALGPAGTGKTYIAVAMAVYMFINRKVDRIVLSRPAVEAGEKLGFLPGDLKEKIDPYLRPLYDALYDMIPAEKVIQHIERGEIEIAPLAFMRGRTLSNSFVILDEAQNTTPTQMKMFLTRMGEHSRMVVTGDLTQTDLPKDVASGLRDAVRKVKHIDGIGTVQFGDRDVVRHELAAKIIQAYDEWDRRKKNTNPIPEPL